MARKPVSKTKTEEVATRDLPLPADHDVTGGDKVSQKMSLLTSLQQAQHDTAKSVIQNIRV